jgi:L-glutamine:2-deoxy-scyllo-inosose/3-amino-2,3-dideoxy-scyllo-inosose aminotransferase
MPLAKEYAAHLQKREFPRSDYLYDHVVVTHHSALLGDEGDMADIAAAVSKIATLAGGD